VKLKDRSTAVKAVTKAWPRQTRRRRVGYSALLALALTGLLTGASSSCHAGPVTIDKVTSGWVQDKRISHDKYQLYVQLEPSNAMAWETVSHHAYLVCKTNTIHKSKGFYPDCAKQK
jgi:hypothetical protein